jgi:hypothetical protein
MECGQKNKIWDKVITLKVVEMKTQSKISMGCDTLCHLHKCSASLEINKNVKSR